ncbi:MAG: Ni/Fe hydrogenase subunit alpha [bacterium]|nr:Ni/Fe hydrogenase subunit alpha [bacterium]
MKTRQIKVDLLARVEGEGRLEVSLKDNRITDLSLHIFEEPRYFEALLEGREYHEVPDMTSRICGICPVAYQMSSIHALERIFGLDPGPEVRALRRLIYCGEWIESHGLHIYLLHAPDFLGYPSGIHLSQAAPEVVKAGLQLKKIGNQIVQVVGGREIHMINLKVGGFYRAPSRAEIKALQAPLEQAVTLARECLAWVGTFDIPPLERDYHFVALRHPSEYPMNEGTLTSSKGLSWEPAAFEDHFVESHVARSNALHSSYHGESYLVGPLARYALNYDRLGAEIQDLARQVGLREVCRNPFESIKIRAVELLFACVEALRLVQGYEPPPPVEVKVKPGAAAAITEAPRGLLYHRYQVSEAGLVEKANIVPPTSQNLRSIEEDLKALIESNLELDDEPLRLLCEQAIRNYDPCISCATHFLDLKVQR